MKPRKKGSRNFRWIPLTGLIFVQGCLAAAERNWDLLLSPNATENTLLLSSGAFGSYVEALLKWFVKVL